MTAVKPFSAVAIPGSGFPLTDAYLGTADFCRSMRIKGYDGDIAENRVIATARRLQEIEILTAPGSPLQIPPEFSPKQWVWFLHNAYRQVQKTALDAATPVSAKFKVQQSDVLGKLIQEATKWDLHFTYRPLDAQKAREAKPHVQQAWLDVDQASRSNALTVRIKNTNWHRTALDGIQDYLYARPDAFRLNDAMNIIDFAEWAKEAYAFGFDRMPGETTLQYQSSAKKIMTAFSQSAGYFAKDLENGDFTASRAIQSFADRIASMAVSMTNHPALAAPLTRLETEQGISMCWSCLNMIATPKLA